MRWTLVVAAVVVVLAQGGTGAAQLKIPSHVLFDFETPPTASVNHPGAWQWTDSATGLKIAVERVGAPLTLEDLSAVGVEGYGSVSLSPFLDPANLAAIRVYFDDVPAGFGVESVAWDMGDFVGADDDEWWVRSLVPTFTQQPVAVQGPGERLNVIVDADFAGLRFGAAHAEIRRRAPMVWWEIRGGSEAFPMSLFIDNLSLTLTAFDRFIGSDQPETQAGGGNGEVGVVLPRPRGESLGGAGATSGVPSVEGLASFVAAAAIEPSTAKALLARLDAVRAQLGRGNRSAALRELTSFLVTVRALDGRRLDPAAAAAIVAYAETLLDYMT